MQNFNFFRFEKNNNSYIKHKLKYINEDKIAIYGKAFGGFLVTNLMTKDDSMFNCGVAVSPVTSWRNYRKLIFISIFFCLG